MRWIRLWTQETLYGTTNRELALEERAIWFELLCLAGDSLVPGTICVSPGISFTEGQLSQILNAPLDIVSLTLKKLASPEINKISINGSGLISIINWARYQERFDKTEYQRDYMRRVREKQKELDKQLDANPLDSITDQRGGEGKGPEQIKTITPPPSPPTAAKDLEFSKMLKNYELNFGIISSLVAEQMKSLWTDKSPNFSLDAWLGWWLDAFAITKALNDKEPGNRRGWAYIKAILSNCIEENCSPKETQRAKRIEAMHKPGPKPASPGPSVRDIATKVPLPKDSPYRRVEKADK